MKRETFKRTLQIMTIIVLVFLVLFFIPVGADLWSDRNYATGSPWPKIFSISGMVCGIVVFVGWLIYWTKK